MKARHTQSTLTRAFTDSTGAAKSRESATRPFSIRLSDAERQQLEQEAGAQALGTYLRKRLLDNAARRRASGAPHNTAALSQILGKLGRLQLSSSLSDLAAAARVGAIALTPELERDLQTVCCDVREIRNLLIRALGLSQEVRT